MKILQMKTILSKMTQSEINSLTLTNDETVLYSGSIIYYMLSEYTERYVLCETIAQFFLKWTTFVNNRLPDLIKAYDAVYSNYNPLENYSKHETGVDVITDGDKTVTHTPDSEHNTTTTTTSYDTYTDNEQGSGADQPKTEHYISTPRGQARHRNLGSGAGARSHPFVRCHRHAYPDGHR